MPRCSAAVTAAVRSETPSFRNVRSRCVLTVASLTNSDSNQGRDVLQLPWVVRRGHGLVGSRHCGEPFEEVLDVDAVAPVTCPLSVHRELEPIIDPPLLRLNLGRLRAQLQHLDVHADLTVPPGRLDWPVGGAVQQGRDDTEGVVPGAALFLEPWRHMACCLVSRHEVPRQTPVDVLPFGRRVQHDRGQRVHQAGRWA